MIVCPNCGNELTQTALGYSQILPNGKQITSYWACEKCYKDNSLKKWAFAVSEGLVFTYVAGEGWIEYEEANLLVKEKVVFT